MLLYTHLYIITLTKGTDVLRAAYIKIDNKVLETDTKQ